MLQECSRQAAEIYSKMILKTDQEGAKWKEKRIQNESKGSKREPKGSKIDLEAVLSISQESRGDVWAVWGRSWAAPGAIQGPLGTIRKIPEIVHFSNLWSIAPENEGGRPPGGLRKAPEVLPGGLGVGFCVHFSCWFCTRKVTEKKRQALQRYSNGMHNVLFFASPAPFSSFLFLPFPPVLPHAVFVPLSAMACTAAPQLQLFCL